GPDSVFGHVHSEWDRQDPRLECNPQDGRSRQGGLMVNYSNADRMRRGISTLMTTLTGLCTLLAVGALLIILFYIAYRGIGSINLQFLIDRPRPVGEGGGIGNAILGSRVLLLISSVVGLPLGICVGIYLSEIGRGRIGGAVRFIVDT